jgi:hypothetical protein
MNCGDFIHVAGTWADSSTIGEPSWRSSTSRAYYGAFHIAREFLENRLGFVGKFTGHKSHGRVSNALIASGLPDAMEAGRMLSHLIRRRHRADYVLDDGGIGVQSAAQHSVDDAHDIRSLIEHADQSCNDPAVLGATTAAVQIWVRVNPLR